MLKYFAVLLISALTQVDALTTDGGGKAFSYTVTSSEHNNASSQNFKNYLNVGGVNEDMSSDNFKAGIGFARIAPYLDGEACDVYSECLGGFCCSNSCSSTACAAAAAETGGGDDGGGGASGGGGGSGGSGGGGGGVGAAPSYECLQDSDCGQYEYCFDNACREAECFDDSICKIEEGEKCWNYRCVKLFDVVILDFESPVKLGEFFNFAYFIKGVADINDDVTVHFQIEKNNTVITSGSDTIYMGSYDEKTRTSKLFLPGEVASGVYEFTVQVSYGTYSVSAHRTVEILVGDKGTATITLVPEIKIDDYLTYALIGFAALIVCLIFYYERKNIKAMIIREEKWYKKHKASILTLTLFVVSGVLIYRFKWHESIVRWLSNTVLWSKTHSSNLSSAAIIISISILLVVILNTIRKKKFIPRMLIRIKKARDLKAKRMYELQKQRLKLKEERESLRLKLRLERQRNLEKKREEREKIREVEGRKRQEIEEKKQKEEAERERKRIIAQRRGELRKKVIGFLRIGTAESKKGEERQKQQLREKKRELEKQKELRKHKKNNIAKFFRSWGNRIKKARDLKAKRRYELQKQRLKLKEERENLRLKLRLERQRQRNLEKKSEEKRWEGHYADSATKKLNKLIETGHKSLDKDNVKKAKKIYGKLIILYGKLSNQNKAAIYNKLNSFYKGLSKKHHLAYEMREGGKKAEKKQESAAGRIIKQQNKEMREKYEKKAMLISSKNKVKNKIEKLEKEIGPLKKRGRAILKAYDDNIQDKKDIEEYYNRKLSVWRNRCNSSIEKKSRLSTERRMQYENKLVQLEEEMKKLSQEERKEREKWKKLRLKARFKLDEHEIEKTAQEELNNIKREIRRLEKEFKVKLDSVPKAALGEEQKHISDEIKIKGEAILKLQEKLGREEKALRNLDSIGKLDSKKTKNTLGLSSIMSFFKKEDGKGN